MKRGFVAAGIAAAVVLSLLWMRGRGGPSGDSEIATAQPRAELPRPHRPLPGQPTAAERIRDGAEPVGPLAIAGRVVDEADQPVAGAIVGVDALDPAVTRSAADGSFRIDGLFERVYLLEARAGPLFAGPVEVRPDEGDEPVLLRMQRGASLAVTVRGDGGAPVAGATVELLAPAPVIERTDANGQAMVPGVPYQAAAGLRVSAAGYAAAWVSVYVDAEPGGEQPVEIDLRRGAPVSGVVVDPSGRPVGGARVAIARCAESAHDAEAAVVTDAAGRWQLPVLPPGDYLLVAGHPAHAPGQAFVETTGEDPAEVTIALRPGQRLDGRVVDGAGQPVARAEITAQPAATEEYELVPPVTVWSGNDGAFAFFGLDDEDVTVWATHQLGRSDPALVALPAGSPVVLTIAKEGRARVRGTVRFDDGGAPDEIEVGDPFERVTLRETGGAFAISVGAHVQDFRIHGPDFEDETVALEGLEPGEERDLGVITVRRGRAVRGTLAEADGAPRAGIAVTVGTMLDSFDRWATRSGSSGADGVFVVRGLPSAPLVLRVEWPGGFAGHLPIDIPAGDADVDLGVIGERDTVNPLVEELTRDLMEALEEGTRKP